MGVTLKLVLRRLLLIAAAIVAAAYPASRYGLFEWPGPYDPLALPDLTQKPNFLTPWQMRLVDLNAADCVLVLQRAGVSAHLRTNRRAGSSCEVTGAITVNRFATARMKPEDMRCTMAARLYMWERHRLQPIARNVLGEEIAEVLHFGSFSCRTIRGGRGMSQHATANAFDISGFKTKSGKLISIKREWGKATPEGVFLSLARNGLCDWFSATLSPDYNADHADHFHVDMGWWKTCR